MDRLDPNVAKCQIGFIDFLVTPLFEIWRKGLGDSEHNRTRIENIAKNRRYWEGQLSEKKPEEQQPQAGAIAATPAPISKMTTIAVSVEEPREDNVTISTTSSNDTGSKKAEQ